MTAVLPVIEAAMRAVGDALEVSPWAMVAILDATLQDYREGSPLPVMLDMQAEAESWATFAAPSELEAHLVAIVKHLADAPVHVAQRKRLIAAIWKSLGAEDRAAFIAWSATVG